MSKGSSRFGRGKASRSYKRRFLLICEGDVTEPDYFNQLRMLYRDSLIELKCLNRQHSGPHSLIKRANQAKHDLQKGDELWIILDVDEWTDDQFMALEKWSSQQENYHVAVSKPCFEIWLIFHEKNPNNCSKKACQAYFERNIASGEKGLRANWLTPDKLQVAISRAKARDTRPQGIVPDAPTSRVYLLIENIDEASSV